MPQYYGSTDPQSATNTPAQTYSNFNGVNSPVIKSTGTQNFSGTFTSTGTMNLTGTNAYYFVGSSSGAINGTSQSTGVTFNIPALGVQHLLPAGSSMPFYLLDTPSAGKIVDLYCLTANTSHPVQVYTDVPNTLGVYFKNAGSGVHTTSNCLMTMYRGAYVRLMGYSTAAWLITGVSTWGTTGSGIGLSSST